MNWKYTLNDQKNFRCMILKILDYFGYKDFQIKIGLPTAQKCANDCYGKEHLSNKKTWI